MNIDINGVKITLTQEQLKEISKQTDKEKLKVKDITSIEIAEKVLKDCRSHTKFYQGDFIRTKDWISYQLETIIKAVNYIDNNYQEWIPDFDNSNEYKYIPYFDKKISGWVLFLVRCRCSVSYCQVGFYYKVRESAEIISKLYNKLYDEWIKG